MSHFTALYLSSCTGHDFRTRVDFHPTGPIHGSQPIVSWVNTLRSSGRVTKTTSRGYQMARPSENIERVRVALTMPLTFS